MLGILSTEKFYWKILFSNWTYWKKWIPLFSSVCFQRENIRISRFFLFLWMKEQLRLNGGRHVAQSLLSTVFLTRKIRIVAHRLDLHRYFGSRRPSAHRPCRSTVMASTDPRSQALGSRATTRVFLPVSLIGRRRRARWHEYVFFIYTGLLVLHQML